MENTPAETATIVHNLLLKAAPPIVFEALMDEKQHSKLTGKPAQIAPKSDGEFTVLGGYAHGINIEIHRGKKIVQAWNFAEPGWNADQFSVCTFVLTADGTGAKLAFTQTGIPPELLDVLTVFWEKHYWEKLVGYWK
jgi:uncharacterized protein YndB with AHSA1/START domain